MRRPTPLHLAAVLLVAVTYLFSEPASDTTAPAKPAKASELLAAEEGIEPRHMLRQLFGVGMVPIWICSVLLVTFIFERRKALRPENIIDEKMVEQVVERVGELKMGEAETTARESPTVVGQAWAHALHEFSLGGVALFESLTNCTLLAFKPLRRNLQVISTLAVISPLLGLLGTVMGMIITFSQIAAAGGAEKAKLADGIALALFTTAGGLIVAIPAIIAGRYFSARITALAEQAEAAIYRINYQYHHARTLAEKGDSPEQGERTEEEPA